MRSTVSFGTATVFGRVLLPIIGARRMVMAAMVLFPPFIFMEVNRNGGCQIGIAGFSSWTIIILRNRALLERWPFGTSCTGAPRSLWPILRVGFESSLRITSAIAAGMIVTMTGVVRPKSSFDVALSRDTFGVAFG